MDAHSKNLQNCCNLKKLFHIIKCSSYDCEIESNRGEITSGFSDEDDFSSDCNMELNRYIFSGCKAQ